MIESSRISTTHSTLFESLESRGAMGMIGSTSSTVITSTLESKKRRKNSEKKWRTEFYVLRLSHPGPPSRTPVSDNEDLLRNAGRGTPTVDGKQ